MSRRLAAKPGAVPPPVRYRIHAVNPQAHLFEVSCTVEDPDPQGQMLALPAWNPGSYMLREYARHVLEIHARSGARNVPVCKLDKHTWVCEPATGPLTVTLRVYAWDLSVRGAHLDTTHGFFNGVCVFLRVIGKQARPCVLEIVRPNGAAYRDWRVATAMRRLEAPAFGFGTYAAADYDELIDHPVEMGRFTLARFRARGVPHDIAITGVHDADVRRLTRDLRRVCETQIDFFGRPAPMDRYVFLITALGEGYGGLEHRASSALLCRRDQLPHPRAAPTEGYREFLGLASHEYFHTWNVKRIKPAAFQPYDLDRENYTTLLWAFEGITSYYDDLMLVRAGLLGPEDYLGGIARSISVLARTPARHVQSVAESSFDAWIKYYRQEENAPNAVVSYYLKGALIALGLDLLLRRETAGRRSLDDLMRLLWQRYGKTGTGLGEQGIDEALHSLLGRGAGRAAARRRVQAFLQQAVHGTTELPLTELLSSVGVALRWRAAESAQDRGGFVQGPRPGRGARVDLGMRVQAEGEARITHVLNGGAAEAAGLAPGDVIVALQGLRVTARQIEARLERLGVGATVRLHYFRRDELREALVQARAAQPDTCELRYSRGASPGALRRWLGSPKDARAGVDRGRVRP